MNTDLQPGEGYDLIYKGMKVDVHSQSTEGRPNVSDYPVWLRLDEYNKEQNCDVYVFCRTQLRRKRLWICGWLYRDEFYEKAVYKEKGQRAGCRPCPYDSWRVRIIHLRRLEELKEVDK